MRVLIARRPPGDARFVRLVTVAALLAGPAAVRGREAPRSARPLGTAPAATSPHETPPRRDLGALLEALPGDLVVFEPPRPPAAATPIILAAKVPVAQATLRAGLRDLAFYRRAVPWIVRAEVVSERPEAGELSARLVAWELEVPLWNLEGKLWLRATPNGAELELVEGDLAPGLFRLSALPGPSGAVLHIEARANIGNVNFVTRKLAARDGRAEPAMTATAAYVLLRALAMEAGRTVAGDSPGRWPTGTMAAPDPSSMDGRRLAAEVAAFFAPKQVVALVRSRPDGRLDHVTVALRAEARADALASRIGEVRSWRRLPGWKSVSAVPAKAGARWTVDSSMPFVDFDSVWQVQPGPPWQARAVEGDWVGASMRVQVVPLGDKPASIALFSLHGRLDATGFMPRRLIEAEPLLEHGLSLGLGYVDGVALVDSVSQPQGD